MCVIIMCVIIMCIIMCKTHFKINSINIISFIGGVNYFVPISNTRCLDRIHIESFWLEILIFLTTGGGKMYLLETRK